MAGVSGPFPVDFTRAAVVEHKDVLLRKGRVSSPLEEACQKHQDKKLEFFCSTCKSALCPKCNVIEHKNQVGHDIVKLGDILEQVKGEVESRCVELDNIRESSLQPRAKMAATSLQETDTSCKDAEQEIEEVFSDVVNTLFYRKAQAVEELRSKWKEDRKEREKQKAATASQVSGAERHAALGRTMTSKGLPSHIVAQNQELERAVQEARAEGGKPVLSALRYRVNTNRDGLMKCIQELGTICTERAEPHEEGKPEVREKEIQTVTLATQLVVPTSTAVTSPRQPVASTSTSVTSPRQPVASPSTSVTSPRQSVASPSTSVTSPRKPVASPSTAVTSSTIQTPEFQLNPRRCNAKCTPGEDGGTLTNTPRSRFSAFRLSHPRPFKFLGTCGSVDLAQPALHYWTVRCHVKAFRGDQCEIGLASLQPLKTCGNKKRISDHDIQAPTIVLVREGDTCRLEGRGWTKDLDTPPPPVTSDTPYTCLERKPYSGLLGFAMTLGFLYDNRQPQSPRVLVVETESCRLLGVRRLSPSPDLRPVLRVWPSSCFNDWDVKVEVRTGRGVLDAVTASGLMSLLGQ